ncbi:hypothetical protein Ait01nite_037710 [Actinoplanes italicus]|uniref:PknH-like protein n=1 Tax=Actinoplanes italicus TaxID=113567 RepID=A0A2T0K845_9ACTN|nr:hypothetical protein [Actinoplanes italicus]PRX19259.1 hypothetical protein CLV67_11011 [Actinoplanes italicus]GIE30726.1 hypothetical protein Ait01nite_037710 [Actinoplanes italicus]
MRRIIALTCLVPALVGAVIAGTAAATTVNSGAAPVPAASPPLGDDYYVASDMMKGLPKIDELPEGYTFAGDGGDSTMQLPVFNSDVCGGMSSSIWGPVTSVHREFWHRDGGKLRIEITANGRDFAAGVVRDTAEALTKCPVVNDESGGVTRHAKLPLPALGDASAGLDSITGDSRTRTAVVAWGPVYVGVEETGTDAGGEARFADIVKTTATTVVRIAAGPSADELKSGLVELKDLPEGFRVLSERTADNKEFFKEYDCRGELAGHGTPGVAVQRTFAKGGDDTPVVESVVGTTHEGQALVGAIRQRLSTCPAITDDFWGERVVARLNVPATDITIEGILYKDDPVRARAVFVYRDICAEVWITQVPGLTMEQIEKIVENALGGVFDVYHG